mmetsp:Transcript_16797/g.14700  ORF Transcript_16797/g.14700 Transcript_16797/m.14700 type:complete len:132 (+) Transcript_16797:374-769(+)
MVIDREGEEGEKPVSGKGKDGRLVQSSPNSANQTSGESANRSDMERMQNRYHSVQGINAEFPGESYENKNEEDSAAEEVENILGNIARKGPDGGSADHGKKTDSQGVSRISEVSKSKESSELGGLNKKKNQ